MADASKIRRDLPYLADYGKDIDPWIEDFKNIMEITLRNQTEFLFG